LRDAVLQNLQAERRAQLRAESRRSNYYEK
jgi:hypothetical protein